MSRVKQWPVIVPPYRRTARDRRPDSAVERASEPPRRPAPPKSASNNTEAPARTRTVDQVRGVRSTGIFEVPADTVIQLVVAISSFASEEQTAAVRVRRVTDGGLQPVFYRLLRIGPGGAQRVVVDGLGGERIEVEVTLSSDQLVPTAAVTQFFPADAGILVLVYKSPGDFVEI